MPPCSSTRPTSTRFLSALTRVLTDSALQEQMRARGEAQAARFSWERTAEETLAVYQQLADL